MYFCSLLHIEFTSRETNIQSFVSYLFLSVIVHMTMAIKQSYTAQCVTNIARKELVDYGAAIVSCHCHHAAFSLRSHNSLSVIQVRLRMFTLKNKTKLESRIVSNLYNIESRSFSNERTLKVYILKERNSLNQSMYILVLWK